MKAIRKVLFPTKFESLSFQCIERLLPLKRSGLEEVVFLFVIDRDEVAYNLFSGFNKKLADQMRQEARLRFADWGKVLSEHGIRFQMVIEVGRPEGKILEVSCREGVDLIVAGRQEHVEDAVYLGGTTMGVLRRTAIPVFVCKHSEGVACPIPGESVFENVLLATDFSADSRRALAFVRGLGKAVKQVEVVTVLTERDFRKHSEEEIHVEEAKDREQLEQVCAALAERGIDAEAHLLAGHTAGTILQAARDHHATVIVMGTRGRHGIKEMWLGSASHRVAELAAIPVILVPVVRDVCYV